MSLNDYISWKKGKAGFGWYSLIFFFLTLILWIHFIFLLTLCNFVLFFHNKFWLLLLFLVSQSSNFPCFGHCCCFCSLSWDIRNGNLQAIHGHMQCRRATNWLWILAICIKITFSYYLIYHQSGWRFHLPYFFVY